jgi:hypothetical protein
MLVELGDQAKMARGVCVVVKQAVKLRTDSQRARPEPEAKHQSENREPTDLAQTSKFPPQKHDNANKPGFALVQDYFIDQISYRLYSSGRSMEYAPRRQHYIWALGHFLSFHLNKISSSRSYCGTIH